MFILIAFFSMCQFRKQNGKNDFEVCPILQFALLSVYYWRMLASRHIGCMESRTYTLYFGSARGRNNGISEIEVFANLVIPVLNLYKMGNVKGFLKLRLLHCEFCYAFSSKHEGKTKFRAFFYDSLSLPIDQSQTNSKI